jgi:hypothetical protein
MKCSEVGCMRTAYYNIEGYERKYCKTHKSDNMVEVPKHRCNTEGCNKAVLYIFKRGVGGRLSEYCKEHHTENLKLNTHPLKGEEIEKNTIGEVWKEIKGFEGYYWVSNLGNVKSRYKILKGDVKKYGHIVVALSYLGKSHDYLIHRLVADAFLEMMKNVI